MDSIITILICIIAVGVLAITFVAIWVFKDAKSKGLPAGLWVFLVAMTGSFMGLILYILIARKQEVKICGHCKMQTNQGAYCSRCGNELTLVEVSKDKEKSKASRGLLIASVASLAVVLVLIAVLVVTMIFPREGFKYVSSSSSYQRNLISLTTVRGLRQRSVGDTWEISFREATAGYTFKNSFRSAAPPSRLELDINTLGIIQLIVSQGSTSINEILTEGFHEFDMSDFTAGRIRVEIININDNKGYSSVLTIVSEHT